MQYLKTVITFKNFREKKTFNQPIRFVFEKLLKNWGSIISGSLHWGPNWLNLDHKIDHFHVKNLKLLVISISNSRVRL